MYEYSLSSLFILLVIKAAIFPSLLTSPPPTKLSSPFPHHKETREAPYTLCVLACTTSVCVRMIICVNMNDGFEDFKTVL